MKVKAIVAAVAAAGLIAALHSAPAYAETAQAAPQTGVQPIETHVTVQLGDSLSKIATKHQTTYARLFDANPNIEHPDLIHPGEVLRVPSADEQLASRPLPGTRRTAATPARAVAAPVTSASKPKTYARVAASGDIWDRLARCESSGNWAINTGNGYYGGLQFHAQTWRGYGGAEFAPYAHQASREQQIMVAERVLAKQGWKAWPACTAKLGLR